MAVRTPPSSDLEELEAPERTIVVPAADRPRFPRWIRFLIWTVAVVAVIAVGLQLSGGFPESRTVDVAAKFNQFNDWVIANQRTSPLFVNFLDPLRNGIQTAYDQLVLLLSRVDVARIDRPRRGHRRARGGLASRGRGGVRVPVHGRARSVGAERRDAQPDRSSRS